MIRVLRITAAFCMKSNSSSSTIMSSVVRSQSPSGDFVNSWSIIMPSTKLTSLRCGMLSSQRFT